MSERDDGRWMDDLATELRAEVPVRPEWRSRLLDAVAREPRLVAVTEAESAPRRRGRSFHVRLLVGLAAALLFTALGAGATLAVLSWRGQLGGRGDATLVRSPRDSGAEHGALVRSVSDQGGGGDRGIVRFTLTAPQASRVALVGSFNEWNPVATPLERDGRTGAWSVSLRLPPGRHVYAFVVDGDVTADPAAPRAADDDFGSPNSVVLVSGPAS